MLNVTKSFQEIKVFVKNIISIDKNNISNDKNIIFDELRAI